MARARTARSNASPAGEARASSRDRQRRGALAKRKIRYGVVGLGYIAQAAVLPAFANAKRNCELAALISDDPRKLKALGSRYGVEARFSYDAYEDCLRSGAIDAVYIALPNSMHRDFAVRAARAGVHVLCEKPLGVTVEECEEMLAAAEEAGIKLMTAYRLHFERANLKAVELVQSGRLGEPRAFSALFCNPVREPDNIRLRSELGGGTLYDIGIYCINAARYLFQAEPLEVEAMTARSGDPRFAEVEEMTGAILRFPGERLASFLCSFGAADVSSYQIVGTKGDLRVDPAFEFAGELVHHVNIQGRRRTQVFPKRDQFAPELLYFSDCVLSGADPEPSAREGLLDVLCIEALYASAASGQRVALDVTQRKRRPTMRQEIHRPPVEEPRLVAARSPSGGS